MVLFEMLAGRPPFIGDQDAQIIGRHLFAKPPSLQQFAPGADPHLVALILRMLGKSAPQRPTMMAVAGELLALQNGESGELTASKIGIVAANTVHLLQPRHTTLGQGAGQLTLRRSLWAWSAAAVLMGLVSAVVLWQLLGRPERTPLPATVQWNITSEPAGAEVIGLPEGTLLGRTPLLHELPISQGARAVVLRQAGYIEQRLDLRQDQPVQVHTVLVPQPPRALKDPRDAKSALSSSGKSRRSRSRETTDDPADTKKRSGKRGHSSLHNSDVKLFND